VSTITLPPAGVDEAEGPPPAAPAPTEPTEATDPSWARPGFWALLVATAGLYLWGLGASGWANSFYSAAVQAGSTSWKAFFFGSSDAASFISVDKPPAALWVMELSARVFGVNSWSILVPQALEGVAAVAVLHATVKRWFGHGAALIAGLVLAITPVAALMFRFNNPDSLLVLLLVAAAYCVTRALEKGSTRWIVAAFSLVGFAFLAKMLQAFVVVPAFGFAYLVAAPVTLRKRITDLAWSALAMFAACGWWVAIVELVPASARPYVGGSQSNSVLDLIFGYNGFGRLTGNETGSVGGGGAGPGATSMWGPTGITRMFNGEFGGQVSWLLPTALILLSAVAAMTWRGKRTERTRAAMILWGGWLVITGITFSLGQGIIHPYYTVALAPAIGAIVGIGTVFLWRQRDNAVARSIMGVTLLITAWWSYTLLDRTPDWHPELRVAVGLGGLALGLAILFLPDLRSSAARWIGVAAIVVALAGPAAYTLETVATPHTGAIPSAGPTGQGSAFGRGGGFPGGGALPGGLATGGPAAGGAGGAAGGLLEGSTPSAALTALLEQDSGSYTWVAATVGANSAAGYQLATDDPVMALGGFNGTDPYPALEAFEGYVSSGQVHYFIAGGGGFGGRGGGGGTTSSTSSAISSWVSSHYTATTVGGVTVYDLTQPTS
jgi:4-amino-4-deoxy-L-arabinose transferase-like glycosyltransferase